MTVSFRKVWDKHPYPAQPCDPQFENQCAIRLGVALRGAEVDLSTIRGALCYPAFHHDPKHILRAQELADWMVGRTDDFGTVVKKRRATPEDYRSESGILFIKDGWPRGGDHIDVWDGEIMRLKGGESDWIRRGEVWFWKLDR